MAPLITLVTATLIARALGALGIDYVGSWPEALAIGLAAMFLVTASAHAVQPRRAGLVAIVPPRLPRPELLVTVTGWLEVLGAVGLAVSPDWLTWPRPTAALCLVLLLAALYPANVYAASARRHPHAPTTPIVRRTVLQLLFLAAAVTVFVTSV